MPVTIPKRSKRSSTRQVELPDTTRLMGRVTGALHQRGSAGKPQNRRPWTTRIRRAARRISETRR
ncbi:MAG TPA: hypothetical protein VE570_15420 [Thermoleophilaceae bacterium]|jgi:hypothetical protein|nr:hypothetical protein [Thermoleophilaceae bacterium]